MSVLDFDFCVPFRLSFTVPLDVFFWLFWYETIESSINVTAMNQTRFLLVRSMWLLWRPTNQRELSGAESGEYKFIYKLFLSEISKLSTTFHLFGSLVSRQYQQIVCFGSASRITTTRVVNWTNSRWQLWPKYRADRQLQQKHQRQTPSCITAHS